MTAGEAVAIGFAGGAAISLLITYYLLHKTRRNKIEEAARVLGIEPKAASDLEREGQLTGALGVGNPASITPQALKILLERRQKDTG